MMEDMMINHSTTLENQETNSRSRIISHFNLNIKIMLFALKTKKKPIFIKSLTAQALTHQLLSSNLNPIDYNNHQITRDL